MNCENIKKLISKYFDNQTNAYINNTLFEHINQCSNCKKEFDMLNKIYNLLPQKQNITLNPYFNQKLKMYIFEKQQTNKFFLHPIFKSAKIFFPLATLLFILSFYLIIKTIPIKSVITKQNDFNNQYLDDDDIIIFDLVNLTQETYNPNGGIKK